MCLAPIGSLKKPPSRGRVPGLEQALPGLQVQRPQWALALAVLASLAPSLMTGQWQATRPRTQRGLCSAPTSCGGKGSACRGAGRGGRAGTLLQLGRGRKEAGRAKNVRKRLFTRGRGGIPALPLTAPPKWPKARVPPPREAVEGHGAGRELGSQQSWETGLARAGL